MKNIYFVILALIIVAYFIISIRKNKLSIKTSFGWIIGAIAMIMALDRAIRCGNDTSESVYDSRGLIVF